MRKKLYASFYDINKTSIYNKSQLNYEECQQLIDNESTVLSLMGYFNSNLLRPGSKPLTLINEYINWKMNIDMSLYSKIELWSTRDKVISDNKFTNDSFTSISNKKFYAVKVYSKDQLSKRNISYQLNGNILTQLSRAFNEISLLQKLSSDADDNYIIKLYNTLDSNPESENSGKLYLLFDLYFLGPSMVTNISSSSMSKYKNMYPFITNKFIQLIESSRSIVCNEKEMYLKNISNEETNFDSFNGNDNNNMLFYYSPWGGIFSEDLIRRFVYCATIAINRLHDMNIVHRDIKPDNFLISYNGTIVLADFNSTQNVSLTDGVVIQSEGTYAFFPPECCNINCKDGQQESIQGKPMDMWALGITIWIWFFNKLPFQGNSIIELFEAIYDCKYTIPTTREISENAVDAIKGLLNPDLTKRWTAKQLINSKWLLNTKI